MFNSNKNLINNAKKGNKKALALLYRDNFKSLYVFIRSKVNTNEKAEDICSEAFLKAFINLDKFEIKSSFKSWLYTIAKNIVFDWYKIKFNEVTFNEDSDEINNVKETKEDNNSLTDKNQNLVKLIFNKLKDNYREVLELRFLLSYSINETAEAMNTTSGNIKILQNRAIRKAKQIVDELQLIN